MKTIEIKLDIKPLLTDKERKWVITDIEKFLAKHMVAGYARFNNGNLIISSENRDAIPYLIRIAYDTLFEIIAEREYIFRVNSGIKMNHSLGVVLGETKFSVMLISDDGKILEETKIADISEFMPFFRAAVNLMDKYYPLR